MYALVAASIKPGLLEAAPHYFYHCRSWVWLMIVLFIGLNNCDENFISVQSTAAGSSICHMNGPMDSSDPYKLLLATASHEQQRRQSELNNRMVGNVFLPAIEMRHNKPNAISLKRLQVIEQCIAAENKREAQLAMCKTEQERHQWAKKFHLQRVHEHDLIKALMLGAPTEAELEIVDVEFPRRFTDATTGLRAQISSPDRVFCKSAFTGGIPKAKPHARKKFVLPECQGSPTRKIPPYHPKPAAESPKTPPPPQAAKSIEKSAFGPRASPKLSKTVPSQSAIDAKLPNDLTKSPLNPKRASVPKSAHVRGTAKLVEVSPVRSIKPLVLHHDLADAKQPHLDQVICFEGAMSFHEAQRIAAEAMKPMSDSIEMSTQTTQREPSAYSIDDSQWARPFTRQDSSKTRLGVETSNGRRHTFTSSSPISLTPDSSRSSLIQEADVPPLTQSNSVAVLSDFEEAKAADSTQDDADEQGYEEDYFAESAETTETTENRPVEAPDAMDEASEVDPEILPEGVTTNESDGDLDQELSTRAELTLLLEELASTVEEAQRSQLQKESTIRSPRPTTAAKVSESAHAHGIAHTDDPYNQQMRRMKAVTRIQSIFRGHQARQAFRMALYQEALKCGVLGAMPGTIQGRSGWYQDPKSLMAYYFVIQQDGEWRQKLVVRCSCLILSRYQMQEEISSKVFLPDELYPN